MNNAGWKLTTLAGVIGIGLLVVMNAQRTLQEKQAAAARSQSAKTNGAGQRSATAPPGNTEPDIGGPDDFRAREPDNADMKTAGLGGPPSIGLGNDEPTLAPEFPDDDGLKGVPLANVSDRPRESVPPDLDDFPNEPLGRSPVDVTEPSPRDSFPDLPGDMPEPPALADNTDVGPRVQPRNASPSLDGPLDAPSLALDDEPPAPAAPLDFEKQPALAVEPVAPLPVGPERTGGPTGDADLLGTSTGTSPRPMPRGDLEPVQPTQPAYDPNEVRDDYQTVLPEARTIGDSSPPAEPAPQPEIVRPVPRSRSETVAPVPVTKAETVEPEPITRSEIVDPEPVTKSEIVQPEPITHSEVFEPEARTLEEPRSRGRLEPAPSAARDDEDLRFGGNSSDNVQRERAEVIEAPDEAMEAPEEPVTPLPADLPDDPDAERPTSFDPEPRTVEPEARTIERVEPEPAVEIAPRERRPERSDEVQRAAAAPPPSFDDEETIRINLGVQQPAVSVEKRAPKDAAIGVPMVYEIVVRNAGNQPVRRVVVEDRIPRGVTVRGSDPQAEAVGTSRLRWQIGRLEANSERIIAVQVVPEEEGILETAATVSLALDAGARTTVAAPSLRFDLTGPAEAPLGSEVKFRYRVTNTGRQPLTGVVILASLPDALKHSDGAQLEYAVGRLEPGRFDEVELPLMAIGPGRVVNKAIAKADGGLKVDAESRVQVIASQLEVERSGPRRLYLNRTGTFTNTVQNQGTNTARGVRVVESVPLGFRFEEASAGGSYDPARRTVTWAINRLEPQAAVKLDITLTSVDRGSQTSVIRVVDSAGASAEITATTNARGVSALSIDITDLDIPLDLDQQTTCRAKVYNRGSETSTGVVTSIQVPDGLEVVSAKGPTDYRVKDGSVEFKPLDLGPKETQLIELTLRAVRVGDAQLSVTAQSDNMSEPLRSDEVTTVIDAE